MNMIFEIENYKINVYEEEKPTVLVLIHGDHGEESEIWELLSGETKEKITLAGIQGITWEHDLSPWEAPAAFKKADPFTGGADEHLEKIKNTIIPEIENKTGRKYEKIYIAGYSLAGLFAVYAATKTDLFDGLASASGSMWYPGFPTYMKEHSMSQKIQNAYFSIGDKEAKTKNPIMQTVEENTIEIEKLLRSRGIRTKFERNPGGHFVDPDQRLAKGIEWMITEQNTKETEEE